ncbi:hypothetical protein CCACVL1_21413 [Corchorus capsularis]|uniref:Uncharacterized protein n=1 Tax=Corchorus capsularis TaxID=210143 RepID=A0A1R3H5W7_COCAP|nr:hypothetical protein CCACVL1_21413 [Corchorus capsularis]
MDTPIIKDPNKEITDLNLDQPSINSHSPTFLLHNGFNSSELSDIEMIALQSVSYTSLKDLLPTSPPTITSPTHNSSWHEIPIKNPLVKHAALAYLQPMSSPPEVGERGLFGRLKDRCCGECGCVLWLYDVVFRNIKEAFWERREDGDDYYYDDDDEEREKVD